jgi:hypothetical protein
MTPILRRRSPTNKQTRGKKKHGKQQISRETAGHADDTTKLMVTGVTEFVDV